MLRALNFDELSYGGPAPIPEDVWQSWNFDPFLIGALLLALVLWEQRNSSAPMQRFAFRAGVAVLALVFISPLYAMSSGLFSIRSLQQVLLVAVAAPLFGFAFGGRKLLTAGSAALLHTFIFWFWHLPATYTASLSNDVVYGLMQFSLLGSGVVFWSTLYRSRTLEDEMTALAAVITKMSLLGAFLTFAPQAVYAPHFLTTALYGLSPLQDQQLAGLVIWVASVPFYTIAAWPLLRRWYGQLREAAI